VSPDAYWSLIELFKNDIDPTYVVAVSAEFMEELIEQFQARPQSIGVAEQRAALLGESWAVTTHLPTSYRPFPRGTEVVFRSYPHTLDEVGRMNAPNRVRL
jgi:hypothetical protein